MRGPADAHRYCGRTVEKSAKSRRRGKQRKIAGIFQNISGIFAGIFFGVSGIFPPVLYPGAVPHVRYNKLLVKKNGGISNGNIVRTPYILHCRTTCRVFNRTKARRR